MATDRCMPCIYRIGLTIIAFSLVALGSGEIMLTQGHYTTLIVEIMHRAHTTI
jgi:hypothetical protein